MIVVLDIETIPDGWTPPPDKPDAFPPPWAHQIVTIGAAFLDENYALRDLRASDRDERTSLDKFLCYLTKNRPTLVTWNGRAFDLPVFAMRALRHGLPAPYLFDRDVRYRYGDNHHVDLADQLCDYGATARTSLSDAARLIGLPGKHGTDGGDVKALVEAGEIEKVRRYCLSDVAQTTFLYLRYLLLRGKVYMEPDEYRRKARALYDAFDRTEAADMLALVDKGRLFFE